MAYEKPQPVHFENTQFNHNFDLEDWNIDAVFKDTIWMEFIDGDDGDKQSRGGVIIPENARSLKDFYRIGRVLKVGPDCSDSVSAGCFVIVPPNLGMVGLKKGPNGGKSLFIREELVMAVVSPNDDETVRRKEDEF
jgi:hypothetical protein|tara:strand:+ start:9290 stop:9697 length:408 start_codon:yes stop_codon:yes gene_type:complete